MYATVALPPSITCRAEQTSNAEAAISDLWALSGDIGN
jgi:hypothetical protein